MALEDHRAAIAMKFADKTEPGYRTSSVPSHFCVRQRIELIESTRGLNYSSLWPWLFAVVLSMALWAMLGGLLWWL